VVNAVAVAEIVPSIVIAGAFCTVPARIKSLVRRLPVLDALQP